MLEVRALRYWRQRQALSQEDLGKLAGIPQATIARVEARGTARPSTVRKLAEALGIEPHQLTQPDLGEETAAA